MSDLPVEKGTTEMIIQALANGQNFSDERRDELQGILDNISIDEFLTALIADSDLKEVVAVLDTFHANKKQKEVWLVDAKGNKIYPANQS